MPLFPFESLVKACGSKAREGAQQHKKEEHRDHERASIGRGEESKRSEEDKKEGTHEDLHSGAKHDAIEHTKVGGRTKDIGVDEFPASFLALVGFLFVGHHLIILIYIFVERTHEDHGDHEGEEEDDHDGVYDGEPVHLVGDEMVHGEVDVPPRGPLNVTRAPLNAVGEDHLPLSHLLVVLDIVILDVLAIRGAGGEQRRSPLPSPGRVKLVSYGERLNIKATDATSIFHGRVLENDVDMVVKVVDLVVDITHRKSNIICDYKLLRINDGSGRKVVHDPVIVVLIRNGLLEVRHVFLTKFHLAELQMGTLKYTVAQWQGKKHTTRQYSSFFMAIS